MVTSKRERLLRIALACLAAAVLQSGRAWAQETTGTITGVVTDQTGAILPGATVLVKQIQTGRTTEVISNETGRYTASLLPPGTYEVTFNLSGFQRLLEGRRVHAQLHVEPQPDGRVERSGCGRHPAESARSCR